MAQTYYTVGWMTGNVGLPGAFGSYLRPGRALVPLVTSGPRGDLNPGNPLIPPKVVLQLIVLHPNKIGKPCTGTHCGTEILDGEYGRDSWPGGKRKVDIQMIYHGTAHMLNSLPGCDQGHRGPPQG